MVVPNDIIGAEYETRMRNLWWKTGVIRYIKFLHFDPRHKHCEYYTELMRHVVTDQYRVVLLYADGYSADAIFREARLANMTGADWTWIVSEFTLDAPYLFDGVIAARLSQVGQQDLIDDAVHLVAYTMARMINTSLIDTASNRALPIAECWDHNDNKWKEGYKIVE